MAICDFSNKWPLPRGAIYYFFGRLKTVEWRFMQDAEYSSKLLQRFGNFVKLPGADGDRPPGF